MTHSKSPTTEEAGLREVLLAARSFVELTYDEEGGEEAADAKHVMDQIDAQIARLSQRDDFRSWLESFQQPPHAGTDYIHWLNPKEVLEKFDAFRSQREADGGVRVAICKDGREFVMELAQVMGVVDVCAEPGTSVAVAELMSKMMERAKEDRERWHAAPPHPDSARERALEEALRRIASDHKPSPQYPNDHVWTKDCDACNRQEIARAALRSPAPAQGESESPEGYYVCYGIKNTWVLYENIGGVKRRVDTYSSRAVAQKRADELNANLAATALSRREASDGRG